MFIQSFIPKYIKNTTILSFYEFLRKLQRGVKLLRTRYVKHTEQNAQVMKRHIATAGYEQADRFIEDQRSYTDMSYGRVTMAYAGCEIIATFNALLALGVQNLSLSDMIHEFELDGMALSGRFGTAPLAIRDYLEKKGYLTEVETDSERIAENPENGDSPCILTMYNDRENIFSQIHTICITHDKEGFTAHNAYGSGHVVGPYPTFRNLLEHIRGGQIKPICLIRCKGLSEE